MTEADRRKIVAAIARAESGTTARVGVRIVPDEGGDALERAKQEFLAGGLDKHPSANAALILVAPQARRFAVVGDRALHERVGDAFWEQTVQEMSRAFKSGTPADAIVLGIDRIGERLHEHFSKEAV